MIKKVITLLTAVVLTIALAPEAQAKAITKLVSIATGANHMNGTGAMSGSAQASFYLNSKKSTICSSIKTKGLTDLAAAHIHKGEKAVDGPPFVTFDVMKFNSESRDCVKVAKVLFLDIEKNPSMYYFNIHTQAYFSGAVRGQLGKKK